MSALEEYRNQPSWLDRYFTEIVPKHKADAAIAELEATIERLTFLYKAATGPQQRADLERRWAERGR